MSFECEICPKAFSVKRSLIRHIDSRHRKLKVFCSHCQKPFSRSDSLTHHINTMHQTKPSKKSAEPPKRKERKSRAREIVRVKRERRRLPPPDDQVMTSVNETCPPSPPVEKDESTKTPQQTPTTTKLIPLPMVEFFKEDVNAVEIKPEVHMEVVESLMEEHQNGEDQLEPYSPDKHKRFTAADELDFTVLDMMQQSAIDAKDEDRMFLLSILSDFKRVPVEKKLKVKARIVGAIVDALD